MDKKQGKLLVYLQLSGENLHSVSRKIAATALYLGRQRDWLVEAAVFTPKLTEKARDALLEPGFDRVTVVEGEACDGFFPEMEAAALKEICSENTQVVLFLATPEGRTLSAMTAAVMHTGVTADCTALSFTEEGLLLQTRPAFSGNRMASIVTRNARPQMASLRFASPETYEKRKTRLVLCRPPVGNFPVYQREWVERTSDSGENRKILLAVGGGLRQKEDLTLFRELANRLGGELLCSRALVDRGWMPRSCQIGLSGRSVSTKKLLCFGISGSVQFQAGLDHIETLCAVDLQENTPLMRMADLPVAGNLYDVAKAMLEQLAVDKDFAP